MTKQGFESSLILKDIQSSSTDFNTSPLALIDLKNAGVDKSVMEAMLSAHAEKPTGTVEAVRSTTTANGVATDFPKPTFAQDKPRVYITTSESWFAAGGFAVSDGNGGGAMVAGSVPQTVELIENFSKRCPEIVVTSDKNAASYVVLFDRNTAKRAGGGVVGLLSKVDKIAVFKRDGDLLYSGSTRSVEGAVKDSCSAIKR
jgi:hypothetical protein